MNRLPEQEHRRRLELYHQGLTDREIAEQVFVCKETIRAWRIANGLPGRRGGPLLTQGERKRRAELLASGKSISQIARELGITRWSVYKWMKYWGVSRHG